MPDLPAGTVTLLFTDIEGSTRLLQQLGQGYSQVLSECRRLLRVSFDRWQGYEVDTQGDAFLMAFARASDALCADTRYGGGENPSPMDGSRSALVPLAKGFRLSATQARCVWPDLARGSQGK